MKTLLQDTNGKYSMMRVLSLIVVCGTLPLCYLYPDESPQWSLMIGASLAGKWLQSKAES
jgi:uncharacterized membrane protein YccC